MEHPHTKKHIHRSKQHTKSKQLEQYNTTIGEITRKQAKHQQANKTTPPKQKHATYKQDKQQQ